MVTIKGLIEKMGSWVFLLLPGAVIILWLISSSLSSSFYAHCSEPDATIGTSHYSGFVSSLAKSCAQQGEGVAAFINTFFTWAVGISAVIALTLGLALHLAKRNNAHH